MWNKLKVILLAVIFILGWTNLSYELIILRQLVNFLGSNILITSVIISFILLFLSVGYWWGSIISFSHFRLRKITGRLLLILAFWYMIACHYDFITLFYVTIGIKCSPLTAVFLFSFLWLIVPSVIIGFVTASIGRIFHYLNRNYTGRFMAIDTLGSVFGSLITTLILMPWLGVSVAVFCLVLLIIMGMVLLRHSNEKIYSIFLFLWLGMLSFYINVYFPSKTQPYLIKDDAISRLEIIPDKKENSKTMLINGQAASKNAPEETQFAYVRFMNRVLKGLDKNKKHSILVLGAGGFTIGLEDDENEYTFLDIEPKLKEISEKHFLDNPLKDNKTFIVQDAYFYMLQNQKKYDVIILDVYASTRNIPTNFVTADFFKMIKESLAPSGYMLANIITSPTFENSFSKRIDNTLRSVFPHFLSRQLVHDINIDSNELTNVIYIYHHLPEDNTIYTLDKNSAMYGQF